MLFLLGLFFSSVLLTTGSSLTCEKCEAASSDCSGPKETCLLKDSVCMVLMSEATAGAQKIQTTMKGCVLKDICKTYEDLKGKAVTEQSPRAGAILPGSLVKQIVCSKGPPSLASFFPAFLGLLLMKLLF